MSDGRGGFVAAGIFGLVVISASAGSYLTLNVGNDIDYPRYYDAVGENAVAQQPTMTKPTRRLPCVAMVSRDESDLCAQWRAATAAEHGAFWSFAQMVLSGAGLIGLFVTLWFNRRALILAERGNSAARQIGQAQTKCYIDIESVKIKVTEHELILLQVEYKNAGQSPAIKLQADCTVRIHVLAKGIKQTLESSSVGKVSVPSGSRVSLKNQSCETGVTRDVIDEMCEGNGQFVSISIKVESRFEDVFGNKYKKTSNFTQARSIWGKGKYYKIPTIQQTKAQIMAEVLRRKHIGEWTAEELARIENLRKKG